MTMSYVVGMVDLAITSHIRFREVVEALIRGDL